MLTKFATTLLIVGYLIHAVNFYQVKNMNLSIAMVLFALAMYFLF